MKVAVYWNGTDFERELDIENYNFIHYSSCSYLTLSYFLSSQGIKYNSIQDSIIRILLYRLAPFVLFQYFLVL